MDGTGVEWCYGPTQKCRDSKLCKNPKRCTKLAGGSPPRRTRLSLAATPPRRAGSPRRIKCTAIFVRGVVILARGRAFANPGAEAPTWALSALLRWTEVQLPMLKQGAPTLSYIRTATTKAKAGAQAAPLQNRLQIPRPGKCVRDARTALRSLRSSGQAG